MSPAAAGWSSHTPLFTLQLTSGVHLPSCVCFRVSFKCRLVSVFSSDSGLWPNSALGSDSEALRVCRSDEQRSCHLFRLASIPSTIGCSFLLSFSSAWEEVDATTADIVTLQNNAFSFAIFVTPAVPGKGVYISYRSTPAVRQAAHLYGCGQIWAAETITRHHPSPKTFIICALTSMYPGN